MLDYLAQQKATAQLVSNKLAVRFVADDPPPSLEQRLVRTYELTHGNLRQMMRTLVESPEFWQAAHRPAKMKTPLEFVASAVRALEAEVERPEKLVEWVLRIGQPLYAYGAPTGYPDQKEFWTDAGMMLNRLNFAVALANRRIPGVSFSPLDFATGRDLETYAGAFEVFLPFLLPERQLGEELAELQLSAEQVVAEDSSEKVAAKEATAAMEESGHDVATDADIATSAAKKKPALKGAERWQQIGRNIAYAVAMLLSSPDFQHR